MLAGVVLGCPGPENANPNPLQPPSIPGHGPPVTSKTAK